MKLQHALVAALVSLASLALTLDGAHACACCTNTGQRHVGVANLDSGKREELGRLRFLADAELYVGEGDAAYVKGIATPSSRYELHVAQETNRWIFAFRDNAAHSGTLTLALPATVSIFAVDPRMDESEGGTGPALYKEWKLTSNAAGTGIFAPGMGKGQRITLILQGQGNNCSGADMFSHWTLAVSGPKADYHFFGKFVQ